MANEYISVDADQPKRHDADDERYHVNETENDTSGCRETSGSDDDQVADGRNIDDGDEEISGTQAEDETVSG